MFKMLQAPITFNRQNLTAIVPTEDSATATFTNCSFSCPDVSEHLSSYQIVTRVWTPLELLSSMSLPDSQLILLQQSLTTPNNSWGSSPLLIAESRCLSDVNQDVAVARKSSPVVMHLTGSDLVYASF